MTKISNTPKLIPITNDNYAKKDYEAVPSKVAEVISHEPAHMQKVWDEVSADGFISNKDASTMHRAMGDIRVFGK